MKNTKTRNLAFSSQMFLLHYKGYKGSDWLTNDMTVHVLFHDDQPNMRNRCCTDLAVGFIDIGNGIVRVLKGKFVVTAKICEWMNYEYSDMPKDEARKFYAEFRSKYKPWSGTVSL